jgi:hypothetical protein
MIFTENEEAPMPTDRSPAALARIARAAMRRRPLKGFDTVTLSGPERALASFKVGQPWAAAPFTDGELLAVAHDPPKGCCWWGPARLYAQVHGQPASRYANPHTRALLRAPCGRCRPIVNPPKPKPRSAPAGRSRAKAARSSTTRTRTTARSSTTARARPTPAAVVASAHSGVTAAQAAYNRAALRRMHMNPNLWPHLTRAGRR